jgi:hypothetical protein
MLNALMVQLSPEEYDLDKLAGKVSEWKISRLTVCYP